MDSRDQLAPIAGLTAALSGRYDVEREIGAGGMATVYLARDVKHDRRVALKVLKPELGAVLGVERFLAEIRVTANLQHPNLLPLFDSGEAEGLLFYVMPFVEGESLRARLDRERQLPVADALHIAIAVAGALDLAHRNGVIHRDLKPENILLREGEPVVADFGIALAVSNAGGQRVTQTGLSLGTPQYMSPEQATGDRVIDGRADVYALGAVLYEMLAGEPPHSAATAQGVIAKLMTESPRPVSVLRPATPPHVEAAIAHALEKLPADRFATARDFAEALDPKHTTTFQRSGGSARGPARRVLIPWLVAGTAGIAAVAGWLHRPKPEAMLVVRFAIGEGEHGRPNGSATGIPFAISPDDRFVVYMGEDSGTTRLMLRPTDGVAPRSIYTANSLQLSPVVAPDGRSVAVADRDKVLRIPIDGGEPTTIATVAGSVAGLAWQQPDTIVASVGGAIVAIPVRGGVPRTISRPDSSVGELAQWGPRVSSDGRRIYYISVRDAIGGNVVGAVDMSGKHRLSTRYAGTTILGTNSGQLIWVTTAGEMVAAPESAISANAEGQPLALFEGVLVRPGGAAKAAMSDRGSIVYARGESVAQLVRVTVSGAATPLVAAQQPYMHPRWSPDGKRVAMTIRRGRYFDLWIYDVAAANFTRLTTDKAADYPEWSADGTRVIYRDLSNGAYSLRWIAADGNGKDGVLLGSDMRPFGGMLSADGRMIVFRQTTLSPAAPLLAAVVPTDHSQPPRVVAPSAFSQFSVRLSPNGKYVSYTDVSSGTSDVYVVALDGSGRLQLTSGGGTSALWSRDGHSIYYRQGRVQMVARLSDATGLSVVSRTKLFEGTYLNDGSWPNFDVAPDGQSFLMVQPVVDQAQAIVVLGWASELRGKLGIH